MLEKVVALLPVFEALALLAIPVAAAALSPLVAAVLRGRLDEKKRDALLAIADVAFDAVEGFAAASPTKVDDELLKAGRGLAAALDEDGGDISAQKRAMALDLVAEQVGRDLTPVESNLVRKRLAGRALLSRPKNRRT